MEHRSRESEERYVAVAPATLEIPTIDKAVAPLVVGVLSALWPLFTGGTVDYSVLLSALTALLTYGAVYFVRYSRRLYNKSAAALLVPVLLALVSAYTSKDFNQPELLLAIQALVGAVLTYAAPRFSRGEAAAVPPPSGATPRVP